MKTKFYINIKLKQITGTKLKKKEVKKTKQMKINRRRTKLNIKL